MLRIRLLSLLVCLTLSSCATMIGGKHQRVLITSMPEGATITVVGTGEKITTPGTLFLERRSKGVRILVTLAGYEGVGEDSPYTIDTYFDPIGWLNIMQLQLCFVGFAVDAVTGSMWKFEDHHIINLVKK